MNQIGTVTGQLFVWLSQLGADSKLLWWFGKPSDYLQDSNDDGYSSLSGADEASLVNFLTEYPHITAIELIGAGDGCISLLPIVPSNNMRTITKAIPFLVEDYLIEEVDHYHFTPAKKVKDKKLGLSVLSNEQIRHWLDRISSLISDVQLQVKSLVPDYLCLPLNESGWTILLETDQVTIRTGEVTGFKLPRAELGLFLDGIESIWTDSFGEELNVKVFSSNPSDDHIAIADIENHLSHDSDVVLDVVEINNPHYFWSQNYPKGLNLLHGEFKQKAIRKSSNKKANPVLWLAASVFVFAVVTQHYQASTIESQAQQVRLESENVFKGLFPDAGKNSLRAMKREMRNRIGQGNGSGSGSAFVSLLNSFGQELSSQSLLDQFELESVRFNDRKSELDIQLKAKAVSQLEKVKQGLAAKGISADIASVANEDGVVKARFKVGGANNG